MLGFALLLLVGLTLSFAGVVWYTAHALTHPPRRTYASALARGLPGEPTELDPPARYEQWNLKTPVGELGVWDLPGDDPDGPVIVLTHGWSDSRIGGLARVPSLRPHASRLLLWDQPGHGESPGVCDLGARSHEHLVSLVERLEPERQVVLYGWSMGAGLALAAGVALGSDVVDAVVAEAPYVIPRTPADRVLAMRGLPRTFTLGPALALAGIRHGVGPAWRGFDRGVLASRLGSIRLLVLHGDRDTICPLEDGRAIAGAAPEGRLAVVEGGGHSDLWTDPDLREASAHAVGWFLGADRSAAMAPSTPLG